MLEPEIKKEWIKRLRSGDYEQGQQHLCKVDTKTGKKQYCCFGVLADIFNSDGWHKPNLNHHGTLSCAWSPIDSDIAIGIECEPFPDDLIPSSLQFSLTSANDAGTSFEHIAIIIENDPRI